jgi:hypothetical protein
VFFNIFLLQIGRIDIDVHKGVTMEAYSSIPSSSLGPLKDVSFTRAASNQRRMTHRDFLKSIIERRSAQKTFLPSELIIENACSSIRVNVFERVPQVSTFVNSDSGGSSWNEEIANKTTFSFCGEKRAIAIANRLAALDTQQRMFGDSHPDVIFSLQYLAALYCRYGEYSEAEKIFRERYRRIENLNKEPSICRIPSEIFVADNNSQLLLEDTNKVD